MTYQELYYALNGEQMKKEASLKKLASMIGMKKKAADDQPKNLLWRDMEWSKPAAVDWSKEQGKAFAFPGHTYAGPSTSGTAFKSQEVNPFVKGKAVGVTTRYPKPRAYLHALLRRLPSLSWKERLFGPGVSKDPERHAEYNEDLREYGRSLQHAKKYLSNENYMEQLGKDIPSYTESARVDKNPWVVEHTGLKKSKSTK